MATPKNAPLDEWSPAELIHQRCDVLSALEADLQDYADEGTGRPSKLLGLARYWGEISMRCERISQDIEAGWNDFLDRSLLELAPDLPWERQAALIIQRQRGFLRERTAWLRLMAWNWLPPGERDRGHAYELVGEILEREELARAARATTPTAQGTPSREGGRDDRRLSA